MNSSRTLVDRLGENLGNRVLVKGYTEKELRFSDLRFLFLRDRSGTCQVIIPSGLGIPLIRREDIVSVDGVVAKNPKSRYDGIEIVASHIEKLSSGLAGKTIPEKTFDQMSLSQRLDNRANSFKSGQVRKNLMASPRMIRSFRDYLNKNDFIEVNTPKILGPINNNGSAVFKLDYFGRPASLSQSSQLYHQMMLTGFERVYEVNICFRAENSTTTRHVSEFQSLDLEMAFCSNGEEMMNFLEKMLRESIGMGNGNIVRVSYDTARKVLGGDPNRKLSGKDKQELCRIYGTPEDKLLFVHSPDLLISQFYAKPLDGEKADAFKLLYRGIEIAAGGQRIHDYGELLESMKRKKMNEKDYGDYLEAFKLGIPPHSGVSIGIPRLAARLMDVDNVKEVIFFPRDPGRLGP